ncbi:MAG: fumarate reductase subunit C [Cardiobacteriaceae bacterium]|nr:fumarate reductase subunit C [Cardiobacteriaceae bacterium]
MARKPYIHQQPDKWYMENRFYQWYMLRELTSITTALVALNIFYGIASLSNSPDSWASWIAWQKNPIMLLINLAGIVGALLNSKTWFEAMPKAIRIQKGERFVADKVLIGGSWVAFGGVLFILLVIVAWLA